MPGPIDIAAYLAQMNPSAGTGAGAGVGTSAAAYLAYIKSLGGGLPSWLRPPSWLQPKGIVPSWSAPAARFLLGRALPVAAAWTGGYKAGEKLMSQLRPEDYYYNPTPEIQAKEFGIAQMTPYAAQFVPEQMRPGTTVAQPSAADQAAAARALRQVTQSKPPAEAPLGFMEEDFVGMDTTSFPGWGIPMYKNKKTGAIRKDVDGAKEIRPALKAPEQPGIKPTGAFSSYTEALTNAGTSGYTPVQNTDGFWYLAPPQKAAPRQTYERYGKSPYDNPATPEEEGQFNPNTGQWEAPQGWISPADQRKLDFEEKMAAADLKEREATRIANNLYQMQQLEFQKQQQAALIEQRKQEQLANLRANPASWLEYASLAGQTPSIQPWMMPLGQGQFEGQAGQPLPGYQAGGQTMNLPQLTTPSTQYLNRMSPTARQQYYGYEKARTGANPADVEQRLWTGGPPSGQFPGMRRSRTR